MEGTEHGIETFNLDFRLCAHRIFATRLRVFTANKHGNIHIYNLQRQNIAWNGLCLCVCVFARVQRTRSVCCVCSNTLCAVRSFCLECVCKRERVKRAQVWLCVCVCVWLWLRLRVFLLVRRCRVPSVHCTNSLSKCST